MLLSERIRDAVRRHQEAYPHGDWRAVNDDLSALFRESYPILMRNGIDPWVGGNEGVAAALERLGY